MFINTIRLKLINYDTMTRFPLSRESISNYLEVFVATRLSDLTLLTRPQVQSALLEWSCLSYDSKVQGNKILGSSLQSTHPELYEFPKLWRTLSGQDRQQLFLIQKKALVVLSHLKENSQATGILTPTLGNQLRTVEFLSRLSLEYGQKLTAEAYERLKSDLRSQLDSGETVLTEAQETQFKDRLASVQKKKIEQQFEFELPAPPVCDQLPCESERMKYWETLSPVMTRSREGHIGVFYVHNPEFLKDLVVKAPLRPAQECFAARLFQQMGMIVANTQVVDRKSLEGKLIEKSLKSCPDFQTHCEKVPFSRYLVMNRIYGCTIEEIDQPIAAAAFTNDRASLLSLLRQMGSVAAMDVFMHYQDRMPFIGLANWGNLMCIEHEKRLAFAAAIDQSVDLSKPTMLGFEIDKMGRIEEISSVVLSHPLETSEAAKSIWEGMPEPLKELLSEEEGAAAVQEGLVAGFQKIASNLQPDVLRNIDAELHPLYTKIDVVKVDDLIRAHEIISAKCSSLV